MILSLLLYISRTSEEFDGCIKLINKKEENINFFKIPEINLDKFKF